MDFTKVKKNISEKVSHNEKPWMNLADEAKAKLAETKLRAAKLRAAIRFFEQQAESGAAWPGSGSDAETP